MAEETTKQLEYKWYVVRSVSGKEKKVREYIESEVKLAGYADLVRQVLIPTEKVYTIRNGKKTIKEKTFFPGYILIEAALVGDLVTVITSLPNVAGFIEKNNPVPLRESEVNRILGKVDEMMDMGETSAVSFVVGETIKVVDGPFNDFTGVVEEVSEEKKKLRVMVKIFGRRTPLELNYTQVEKT
jgi:transcriptional antiterminator NusG